jgi:hypothetical protein
MKVFNYNGNEPRRKLYIKELGETDVAVGCNALFCQSNEIRNVSLI